MRRLSMIWVFLLIVGCGVQPLTNLDVILASCDDVTRESVLQLIESTEETRRVGLTFSDNIDLLDEGSCGESPSCRRCVLVVLEWVYFGTLP